jgi:hypothetical protein
MHKSFGVGALLALSLSVKPAHAFNWKTHSRLVEIATEIMAPSFPNSTTAPAGIDQQAWTDYLSAINGAVDKLSALKSGLPDAGKENQFVCGYPTSDNMSQIPNTRIEDLNYLPLQGGVVLGGNQVDGGGQCSETPILCADDNGLRLGMVLGYQAAAPDDHLDDTALWIKPTNAAGLSVLVKGAAYAVDLGVAALVFPFVCLYDLFSGGDCDIHHAIDIGNEVNPVDKLWGSIPGFRTRHSYDWVGLWHFVDQDSPIPGFYNTTRGMLYENAGPGGVPGLLDIGIMIGTDFEGRSLNASRSQGVDHYGQFDQRGRTHSQWQAYSIAHTEFSPATNLARYGWSLYTSNPTSAYGLAWPLHALGDAAVPMHAAGTTSWGHRPFEDEVDHLLDRQLLPPPASCTLNFLRDYDLPDLDPTQAADMLQIGFDFWSKYRSQFAPGNVPVQAMVADLAQRTVNLANQQNGAIYDDVASVLYEADSAIFCPDDTGCQDNTLPEYVLSRYEKKSDLMPPYLENGVGAIIAFLAGASLTVQDPGPNTNQGCGSGNYWDPNSETCRPGIPVPPSFAGAPGIVLGTPVAGAGGQGAGGASSGGSAGSGTCTEPCQQDSDCPQLDYCSAGCCAIQPH